MLVKFAQISVDQDILKAGHLKMGFHSTFSLESRFAVLSLKQFLTKPAVR